MAPIQSPVAARSLPLRFPAALPGFDWTVPAALAAVLAATGFYHYLLFHTLAELFAVCVAILAAVVGWHAYPYSRNDFLMYLATGYFWIAVADLAHTLTFKGMGVLPIEGANIGTQFWLVARYLEAFVLVTAPLFLDRRADGSRVFLGLGALLAAAAALVISGRFPAAFVEGEGLTGFKVVSEYAVIAVLFVAMAVLWSRRGLLDIYILRLMTLSIAFTILAEGAFTLYTSVDGLSNMLGHVAKLFSFWFIYVAVVQVTLAQPFRTLARDASTYDAVPDPTIVVSSDGEIHQVNEAARRLVGKADTELLGGDCHALFHPRTLPRDRCPVCRRLARGQSVEPLEMHYPETDTWQLITLSPVSRGGGAAMVHVARDITARKKAEAALQSSERRYRAILENASDGIVLADLDGRILDINHMLLNLLGYSRDELVGGNVRSLHPPSEYPRLREAFDIMNAGEVSLFEHLMQRKDGSVLPMEAAGIKVDVGEESVALGVFRDIRERKRSEAALRSSEEKYRTLVENLPQSVFIKDREGRYISCNRNYAEDLGIEPEDIAGRTDFDFHPSRLAEKYRQDDARVIATGEPETIEEMYIRDDEEFIVHTVKTPVRGENGDVTGVLGIFWDVTQQKLAEASLRLSEARYRAVVEDQTDLIARFRPDGSISFVNEAMCRYYQREQDGIAETSIYQLFVQEERQRLRDLVADALQDGLVRSGEFRVHPATDGIRWCHWTVRPILGVAGRVEELQGVGRDVTERHHAEAELRRSLAEKEVLLREVHHRVKNNMQVISSLLGLEALHLSDPRAVEAFNEAESRIRSMALVHERLYRFGDLSRIDCRHYLTELVSNLMDTYAARGHVESRMDVEDVALSLDYAIPFGLVVNELVSNALKHAFAGARKGILTVSLHREGSGLRLQVQDDGQGMPPSLDVEKAETMGLKLIRQLVRMQLDGTVEVDRSGGTRWTVHIGKAQ